ncbi:DUF2490 domain-containing protein [Carboxylicivirga sp. M1479]|uniref:DUF2490 domain-containing protein n=1 Tax=Carboxylicivirga sp. M1479 TaxID=2594476 RepID=UPI001178895B|nr:DUF2490 domain-containing protein [Carboxylicivirga sp. M1479]TRX66437.1 DUF2490 domain-containing protein [Carboxylicivirga sp. M1479]
MKKYLTISLLFLLAANGLFAQVDLDLGLLDGDGELRTIYVQRHRLNDQYIVNLDLGAYIGLGNNIWTRWGYRGSILRNINDFYKVDLGFMYNRVHLFDEIDDGETKEKFDLTSHELRPHQTLHVNYPRFQSSVLKHRFRLEERFFTYSDSDYRKSKVRLRYRVMHSARFDGKTITPKSLFYRASAEFNFNIYQEAEDVFWVRGRYTLGLGYQFSAKLSADMNYFYEHTKVGKDYDQIVTHIFHFAVRHTINWNK